MTRLQSAMEYLMTYGWAIIIIAVALTALYSIGVFNNSAPKTQGGACSILRPEGPGTTEFAQTSGLCNNEEPQFVSSFTGVSTSYIGSIPENAFPIGDNAISVFAWVETTQSGTTSPWVFAYGNSVTSAGTCTSEENWELGIYNGHAVADLCGEQGYGTNAINDGKWHFIGFVYQAGASNVILYEDGASNTVSIGSLPNVQLSGTAIIGSGYASNSHYFTGEISNIQLYSTALSSNDVSALYYEGIGGAPINPAAILGWWQLNGGPQDYSGNIYGGITQNVVFTSTWTSGYTVP